MSMTFPEPYIINPTSSHKRTIIFLHGRGSSGKDFASDIFEGRTTNKRSLRDLDSSCKWIFPNAPLRTQMPEWFDIYSLTNPEAKREQQVNGLRDTINHVNDIIDAELKRLPARSIVLGGISQGYAAAIHALLSRGESLGGFIGMSGWLPFQSDLRKVCDDSSDNAAGLKDMYGNVLGIEAQTTTQTLNTPVWLSHSVDDWTVQLGLGTSAHEVIEQLGMNVQYHQFDDGGHWLQEPNGHDQLAIFIESFIPSWRRTLRRARASLF